MSILEALFLGIVQGLTEFLPISSSAHLRIVGGLFPGLGDPGVTFTAVTQIGTETAVIIYFWQDIKRIISSWFKALPFVPADKRLATTNPDVRLGWIVIFGTLPIVVLGLLLEDYIDTVFRNLYITAVLLAVFAIFLALADKFSSRRKELASMTIKDGILLGFAQAMALVPGVSRSGGTITAGLMLGYTRETAARISFLLAIPAIMGSGFYRLLSDSSADTQVGALPLLVATVTAFVVGYAVIVWFLKLVQTKTYTVFVVYRLVLAGVLVALLGFGLLSAY